MTRQPITSSFKPLSSSINIRSGQNNPNYPKTVFGVLLAAAVSGMAVPQQALAVPYAAQTGVTTISPCPSFCGGPGSVFDFDIDGGPNVSLAQSLIAATSPNDDTGAAVASLNPGTLGLPQLGADAFAAADSRVSSEAAAMNKYTYSGPSSNFTLQIVFEGLARNGTQDFDANLQAYTDIVLASDLGFSTDVGTFRGEIVPLTPGTTTLAQSSINFLLDGLVDQGFQQIIHNLNFTLNNGDEVYIWASVDAEGTRTGVANGGNTYTAAFTAGNVAGLTPAYVPVPAAAWLFGTALIGFIGIAKRRQSS